MAYRPFTRGRDGALRARLRVEEVDLLVGLAGELTEILTRSGGDDPALRRLFPRAYLDPTEERAEEEYRALAQPDLLRTRLDALAALTASLREVATGRAKGMEGEVVELVLDAEQEAHWLAVLNDARLALGSYLGVTEETTEDDFEAADPSLRSYYVYAWLTALQGELIELLLDDLPDDPSGG